MLQNVLLAVDDSLHSSQAVPYVTVIARAAGARVCAYRAIPDEALRLHAERQLGCIAEGLSTAGVKADICVEYSRDPAEAIAAAARALPADLIAMATAA
jgi:nucleotide-binding universal stress UspA family protein